MDIGMIVINLARGQAIVSRWQETAEGMQLVAATNAPELEGQARRVLVAQDVSLDEEGVYLCSDELQVAAQFSPLQLPADAITYGTARSLLYPTEDTNMSWKLLGTDVKQGRLRVWRVGVALETRRLVSRSAVDALLARRYSKHTSELR